MMPPLYIEDELLAVLREVETERDADILTFHFGFNEAGPTTLEVAGQEYGLTRERVRQIAVRAKMKIQAVPRPLPCLERVKTIISSELWPLFTAKEFSEALIEHKISKINFNLKGVLKALELVGEKPIVKTVRVGEVEFFGAEEEFLLPRTLLSVLRKETSANGCSNIQRLALLVGRELDDTDGIRGLLLLFPEAQWLSEDSAWLLSTRPTRNRLANISSKIFCVAPSLHIKELRSALRRHVRLNFVPPATVLEEFLEYYGIAKVVNGRAVAAYKVDQTALSQNEQGLIRAFEALGSPATREQLEAFCIDELKMNINSFYQYLSYSPFVVKLATGVFGLIGHDVAPGAITQIIDETKDGKAEDSSGWSKVGTLWWHFPADRPTAKTGCRAVPSFVLKLTSGEWNIRSIDGLKLGVARVEAGFMSGARSAFLALGVTYKDFLQFDFDMAERRVFVRIVSDEPEELSDEVT